MTQHTPGPWFSADTHECPDVMADGGFLIAKTRGINCEANARLIAAAPDMLAALEAFVGSRKGDGMGWTLDSLEALAREAIAKAKGGAA
jgi:hypothetical protein